MSMQIYDSSEALFLDFVEKRHVEFIDKEKYIHEKTTALIKFMPVVFGVQYLGISELISIQKNHTTWTLCELDIAVATVSTIAILVSTILAITTAYRLSVAFGHQKKGLTYNYWAELQTYYDDTLRNIESGSASKNVTGMIATYLSVASRQDENNQKNEQKLLRTKAIFVWSVLFLGISYSLILLNKAIT